MQIGGEALEPADRVRIPIGPDRHVVRTVADVDPGGVGMHNLQAGVLRPAAGGPIPCAASDSVRSGVWQPCRSSSCVSQTRCGPVAKGV